MGDTLYFYDFNQTFLIYHNPTIQTYIKFVQDKEVVMKNRWRVTRFFLIVITPVYLLSADDSSEQKNARQQLMALKELIKKEEILYTQAMQTEMDAQEKDALALQYKQKRKNLFEQVQQQRNILNKPARQQMLWNAAKAAGLLAVAGLIIYNFFTTPAGQPEQLIMPPDNQIVVNVPDANPPTIENEYVSTPLLPENLQPSLTQYERYRNRSNVYGNMTAALGLVAVLSGHVILLPLVASMYMGSLYYGMKALQQ